MNVSRLGAKKDAERVRDVEKPDVLLRRGLWMLLARDGGEARVLEGLAGAMEQRLR